MRQFLQNIVKQLFALTRDCWVVFWKKKSSKQLCSHSCFLLFFKNTSTTKHVFKLLKRSNNTVVIFKCGKSFAVHPILFSLKKQFTQFSIFYTEITLFPRSLKLKILTSVCLSGKQCPYYSRKLPNICLPWKLFSNDKWVTFPTVDRELCNYPEEPDLVSLKTWTRPFPTLCRAGPMTGTRKPLWR